MAKILVVEDDSELRDNICEMLTQAGFVVQPAENAERALELAGPEIDLVLLDMIMPGMGGAAAVPLLKKRNPALRIVIVTAFATVESAVEAMRRGANDYITKPFKANQLLISVTKNLEEAKFSVNAASLDIGQTLNTLSNTMRRNLLHIIAREQRIRCMELARRVELKEHSKMNFHLKVLREAGLVQQDAQKFYTLTAEGKRAIECLGLMADFLGSPQSPHPPSQPIS